MLFVLLDKLAYYVYKIIKGDLLWKNSWKEHGNDWKKKI